MMIIIGRNWGWTGDGSKGDGCLSLWPPEWLKCKEMHNAQSSVSGQLEHTTTDFGCCGTSLCSCAANCANWLVPLCLTDDGQPYLSTFSHFSSSFGWQQQLKCPCGSHQRMIARHLSHLLVSSRHWDIETTFCPTFDDSSVHVCFVFEMNMYLPCSIRHACTLIAWLEKARRAHWRQTKVGLRVARAANSLGDTWHCSARLPSIDISICHLQTLQWSPTLSSQTSLAAGFTILLIVTQFSFAPSSKRL